MLYLHGDILSQVNSIESIVNKKTKDTEATEGGASKTWQGMSPDHVDALIAKQMRRILSLEEILQQEREELASLMAAKSGVTYLGSSKFRVQQPPLDYSSKLSWKDKILFVVKDAGKPILGGEIGARLQRLQPHGLNYTNLNNTVSVHLSKLVKAGALVRLGRGKFGSLFALPE